jgi:S-adenosylmethionine decarboxylase
MFGPHLLLDCYGCDKKRLKDLGFVIKFLDGLVDLIGMHKIAPPHAFYYPGKPGSFDKGGVSGIVIITESHISIHTFPHPNGYVNIDIFSCKEFDINSAIAFTVKAFKAKKFDKKLLMRGREFPKNVPKAVAIVRSQRQKLANDI